MVRRWPFLGAAAILLSAGALAYASNAATIPSQPLSGRVPGVATKNPRSQTPAGHRYQIVIEPSLDAGDAGWASFLSYSGEGGGGGGGGYPTSGWPFFGGGASFTIYSPGHAPSGDVVDYALTGPDVAAVRIGQETVATFTGPQLPAGDRAAVFFRRAALPSAVLPGIGFAPGLRRMAHIVALDSSGHVIPVHLAPTPTILGLRFWQAPSAITPNIHEPPYHGPKHPLPGACELTQHGLPGLSPEWGHAINRVRPVTDSQGEVLRSCIDTEYYLHGWPLEVAVLVDAVQPGQTLGPIPGGQPVTGHPGTVNLAPGSLTAQQVGEAWLVVQGGASLAQRLRVLGALRITKLSY